MDYENKEYVKAENRFSNGIIAHLILHCVVGIILLIIGIAIPDTTRAYSTYDTAYETGQNYSTIYCTLESKADSVYVKFDNDYQYSYTLRLNSNYNVYYSSSDSSEETQIYGYYNDYYYNYDANNFNENYGYFRICKGSQESLNFSIVPNIRSVKSTSLYYNEANALSISNNSTYIFDGSGTIYLKVYSNYSSYTIGVNGSYSSPSYIYYAQATTSPSYSSAYLNNGKATLYLSSYDYYYIRIDLGSAYTKVTISSSY